MEISNAYNEWSASYDAVENKTRDMESHIQEAMIGRMKFNNILEWGCGTGKNTLRLSALAHRLTAVDFSIEMINKAKQKIQSSDVEFKIADITRSWNCLNEKVDLISCSLILEHVQDLDHVFQQANTCLQSSGFFYIGELHPFKQYLGGKARFENQNGVVTEINAYVHHVTDYINSANKNSFRTIEIKEGFDDGAASPRIIAFLFQKK